jgi:hypothetical protein
MRCAAPLFMLSLVLDGVYRMNCSFRLPTPCVCSLPPPVLPCRRASSASRVSSALATTCAASSQDITGYKTTLSPPPPTASSAAPPRTSSPGGPRESFAQACLHRAAASPRRRAAPCQWRRWSGPVFAHVMTSRCCRPSCTRVMETLAAT